MEPFFPHGPRRETFMSETATPEGREFDFDRLVEVARRKSPLVLLLVLLTLGVTALYTRSQPRVYEATASVLVSESSSSPVSLIPQIPTLPGAQASEGDMNLAILRSRRVAEVVAAELALHVEVEADGFERSEVVARATADSAARPAVFELRRLPDGRYRVAMLRGAGMEQPAADFATGVPIRLGDATLVLDPRLVETGPEVVRVRVLPFRQAVERLREDLALARAEPMSPVVSISYRSSDPAATSEVANATAAAFIAEVREIALSESARQVEFLTEQVAHYQGQLTSAEAVMEAFREEGQIVSLSAEAEVQVDRLSEMEARLRDLTSEAGALRGLLAEAETAGAGAYRRLASFPVFFANRAVQDLLVSLTELENSRSELLQRRTPENFEVRGIEARITELERQLYDLARNYLDGVENQVGSLRSTLSEFQAELELIPAREIQFARLMRQQAILEEIFTLLQTRLMEAEIRNAVESDEVRILDLALPPTEPVGPRMFSNLLFALVFGLTLGFGITMVSYATDSKVRSESEAMELTGAPVFGILPRLPVESPMRSSRLPLPAGRIGIWPPRLDRARPATELVVVGAPRSAAAEAYRALRTNLIAETAGRESAVLLVASAVPGEGKSVAAANLAAAFALQGLKTLLVDADLRRGRLHSILSAERRPGLADVLADGARVDDVVQPIAFEGVGVHSLALLGSGRSAPNPSELIGSGAMAALLDRVRRDYQVVVIDSPAAKLFSEAMLLSRDSDAVILLNRVGFTEIADLQESSIKLQRSSGGRVGLVLNDAPVEDGVYEAYYRNGGIGEEVGAGRSG